MMPERIGPMHGDQPAARAAHLEAFVHRQERNLEQTNHVESQDDDDRAADARDPVLVVVERRADGAGRQADEHEDDGESAHERQRMQQHAGALRRALAGFELFEARPGEEREIRRDERQHAGRNE
jgi:hypothetical protein